MSMKLLILTMANLLLGIAVLRGLVDGGSNRWLTFLRENSLDLKLPDLISGDFDSITPQTREYFEARKVKFISTPDQDETDFTKALRCLVDMSKANNAPFKKVFVVCESSGRLDQIIANINTLHSSEKILQNIPLIIFSSGCISWLLRTGRHTIYVPEEFVRQQYVCALVPFRGPTRATTNGLKWNLSLYQRGPNYGIWWFSKHVKYVFTYRC